MLNPSHDFYADATHCRFGGSFILYGGEPPPSWPGISHSYITIAPPKPKRVRRRRITARMRSTAYSATLAADDYLEAAREALRAGDDRGARHVLEVLRSIIAVALKTISDKCLPDTAELLS